MIFHETQEEMKKLTNQRLIKIFEFLLTHTADKKLIIWSDEQSMLWNEIKNRLAQEDAIPVEWIKKWANDNSNGEWSVEYRTVFNGILKDWEKENEQSDTNN